jgi:hypothetical protein
MMNLLIALHADAFGEDIFASMKGAFTMAQISWGEAAGRGAKPLLDLIANEAPICG